ncbi:hypothetical protein NLG97_g1150 [Lecanicillium saksenae]|uniref:Uncharacterized protein n=1 Tax=Lecanicillium saksenae TaxID=468837 RepID=A0ACC1R5X2_9HYPO|nr:hypothetical protein NLG97_g1150 [Lecanicillium saksenae]
MSIQQLPHDVVEKIASSSSIISLNDAMCGLVKNSLDASARRINISFDYVRGNCTVEDDGEGIHPEEFGVDGGLAKSNSTSRFPNSSRYHGRHGNFLVSIAALSLLIIESRAAQEASSSSLTIHHGIALSRELAASASPQLGTMTPGTRVSIFDLFGSMPVRVKHRASELSQSPKIEREFKRLGYDLTALLLAWPSSVSVFLRETKSRCQLRLKSPDGPALELRASRLLTQLGLSAPEEASSWIPVAVSDARISIEGCISTIPVATRKAQFISFGIHPVEKYYDSNILLDEVNEIFTSSSFGLFENMGSTEIPAHHFSPTQSMVQRTLEKWPMLYLRIDCSGMEMDGSRKPRDTSLAAIVVLLRALCHAFLRKHKMRSRKPTRLHQNPSIREKEGDPSSFQRGQSSILGPLEPTTTPFDDWHRVKVGHQSMTACMQSHSEPKLRFVVANGQLTRPPFVEDNINGILSTGLCNDTHNHSLRKSPVVETLEIFQPDDNSEWLNKLVRSWKNPVFETTEPTVYRLPTPSAVQAPEDASRQFTAASDCRIQLSKRALKEAEVIAQLDKKFVLIKLPVVPPIASDVSCGGQAQQHVLFAVDQHAADERYKLEKLMMSYFEHRVGGTSAVIESLDQPISLQIPAKEASLFARHQKFWTKWGISYTILDAESHTTEKTRLPALRIIGLPPSILERCRAEQQLLPDLMRKEMWRWEEFGPLDYEKSTPSSNFQGCPRGILELLHSRACRSAIMFNDELTMAECAALIRRLAQCALPFQCAHGRPSMAPLVNLGNNASGTLLARPGELGLSISRTEDRDLRELVAVANKALCHNLA